MIRETTTSVALALVIGALVFAPNALHMSSPLFQGLPITLNSDELSYATHAEEALTGDFGDAGKGITKESRTQPSFHVAPIEEFYGVLFGGLKISAVWLFTILDFVIPTLLALALYALFRTLGFSQRLSLIGITLFCIPQLYSLGRSIQPRDSFLLVILSLVGMLRGMKGERFWGIVGGVLLGILVGTYVWHWMFAWAVWGILLALTVIRPFTKWKEKRPTLLNLLGVGAVGLVFATPFVWLMLSIKGDPAYADTVLRAGLFTWWWPQSSVWSALTLILMFGTAVLWKETKWKRENLPLAALPLAAFVALNQNLVHGHYLSFRSHLVFCIALTTVVALLWILRERKRSVAALCTAGSAVALLSLITWDNSGILNQWRVVPGRFAQQHLAAAFAKLEELPRSVILSDPETELLLAAHTKHDVLYTAYLQHTLVNNGEIAERFCLTQLPVPAKDRHYEQQTVLVYGNAIGTQLDPVIREDLRRKDLALVRDTCAKADAEEPAEIFKRYGVQYLLWNERTNPLWNPRNLRLPMSKSASGVGWSLWQLTGTVGTLP